MNILRKSRKSTIKLDKRKVVLLIFTLIMTTFAWITYSKILLPTLKLHINSWNLAIYVDNNENGVAEETEMVEDKNAPIIIQPFEVYPGMNLDIMDVIIKNNGETPSEIAYIISDVKFLGKDYSIQDDAATYRTNNPTLFCLQKNTYDNYGGIVTYKLINEESLIPFEFIIEHTQVIDGGAEGHLKVKAVWDATLDEGATEAQIDAKNEFDGKWGFDLTKYAETTGAPIEFKLKVNAIGQPRSGRFVLTQDITPENYGDYVDYPIDLNADGDTTNDWRIFYEGNENIYLISANYVPNTWVNEEIMTKSTGDYSIYGAYIDRNKLNTSTIDQAIINKFMLTESIPSNNENYKAVANLMSQEHWKIFKKDEFAEAVIGGPTLEMFVKSWNQKYNGVDGYSELKATWNTIKMGYEINNDYHFNVNGYNNASLYFIDNDEDSCIGYWIAAPSIRSTQQIGEDDLSGKCVLGTIDNTGVIGAGTINDKKSAVRPVVCLKSGLFGKSTVKENGDTVWTLSQTRIEESE